MARYIDADKLKPKTERWLEMDDYDHEREYCMSYYPLSEIENAPTEDVAPIIYANMLVDEDGNMKCSNCGNSECCGSYCMNCGAKMIERKANEDCN